MKAKYFKILLVFVVFLLAVLSVEAKTRSSLLDFVGEELEYKITWFGVSAGKAKLNVSETIYKGKPCIKIKAQVETSKWFSKIYYVKDSAYSIIDPVTLRPLQISVDYQEGKDYSRKKDYMIDWDKGLMYPIQKPEKTTKIPERFNDLFSAFFVMRMTNFKMKNKISRTVVDGRRVYEVTASSKGSKKLRSILGNKDCIEIKPSRIRLDLLGDNQNAKDIVVYLTNDEYRIPVMAKGKVVLGSLVAKLVSLK